MSAGERGRRLGVDVGAVRVGVALSDPDGILATPLRHRAPRRRARVGRAALRDLVAEHAVVEVVVGLPRTLAGRKGPAAEAARAFGEALTAALAVPVAYTDERLTTVVATRQLRSRGVKGRKQRAVIDQAAAVAILQGWLDARDDRPGAGGPALARLRSGIVRRDGVDPTSRGDDSAGRLYGGRAESRRTARGTAAPASARPERPRGRRRRAVAAAAARRRAPAATRAAHRATAVARRRATTPDHRDPATIRGGDAEGTPSRRGKDLSADTADRRVGDLPESAPGSVDGTGARTVRIPAVGGRRAAREAARPRRRARRAVIVVLALLLPLAIVAGGGWYVYHSIYATPDYQGEGTGDVVIQVHDGDTTSQIGAELARRGVVAAQASFTEAAADNDRIRSVQPGYYQMRLRMSGASAVALMLDPSARVGQLEIRGGVQLDDTRAPEGAVTPGVLSLIAQATCSDGRRRQEVP